jgi:lysine 2,3-aminomutase
MKSFGALLLDETPALQEVARKYAVAISQEMVKLLDSPAIAAQFMPSEAELTETQDELSDPIGDDIHSPLKGLVHRYKDRVLIKITTLCPVYCRFCFRREQVGPKAEATLNESQLNAIYEYIQKNDNIFEVILTGGDPLILSPRRLKTMMQALERIEHLKIIRFHTRVPVVSPEKITPALINALKTLKQTYIVIHSNHADEWQDAAINATRKLRESGFPLLSQSVLLKNINNNVLALKTLLQTLIQHGVTPYLLHHPDKARGTSHFRVTIKEGQTLMRSLRGQISGFALPQYILDIPQGHGKIPLTPNYLTVQKEGYLVEDLKGKSHYYGD